MRPSGSRLGLPGVAVLALCLLGGILVAWSSYAGCAGQRVEASEPGGPPREAECVREFTPSVLFLLGPLLLCAAGVVALRPWMAWSGAVLNLLPALLLFLSTRLLMGAVAVALLGAVAWWQRARAGEARPWRTARAAVTGSGALLVTLSLLLLAAELPDFWDPCRTWGTGSSGGLSVSPDGPCQARSGTSETRAGAATRLALVAGTPILLSAVAIVSAWKGWGLPLLACAGFLGLYGLAMMVGFSVAYLVAWPVAALWLGCGLERQRAARALHAAATDRGVGRTG